MIIKVNSNAETEVKDSMCVLTATLDNNFISVDLLIEKT